MNFAAIFPLVLKGISLAETAWDNRDLAFKALVSVKKLISKEKPTQADMDATDAELDALLDEFNEPLPEE